MKRIEISDEIFETYIEPEDITNDLMDVKEIARIKRKSISNVKVTLYRVRKKLKED